jgi:HAD superfamily hydrolase (TIGR01509 family)
MLKALFLDMDETLCDTQGANQTAKAQLAAAVDAQFGSHCNGQAFAEAYVKGIYRDWTDTERQRYMPIIEQQSEGAFRIQLIFDLLKQQGVENIDSSCAQSLQDKFDRDRLAAFNFYPGIAEFLQQARKLFTLVVITNGPEFSQIPKIEAVKLADYVDHIIIGGQEPEQKPAASIFAKALQLAGCEAHEAIHVGDSLAADIAGAHNSGITSVWIQHQQPLDAELGINPHHTVMHPNEIPALVKQLEQQHRH